jgi:hypothetical protein
VKPAKYLDEEKTVQRGVAVLVKELGPVESMRFLSLQQKRRMESVRRHRSWQRALEKEQFFDELFGPK